MQKDQLHFVSVLDRTDLVSDSVRDFIESLPQTTAKEDFKVAEIDPQYAGGTELCENYGLNLIDGASCVIVQGQRGDSTALAAVLTPIGYRSDLNGIVRKHLNARTVKLADLNLVLEKTGMEYGSITPVGLPSDWLILIDGAVADRPRIIIGSGLKRSKLSVSTEALLQLPNVKRIDGLARLSSR